MEAEGWVWSRAWPRRQDRKRFRLETSHKLCREAGRRAECWKSACSVRRGGGWKRVYGSASEALPEETGSKQLGWTYGAPRQSSTLQAEPSGTAPVLHPTDFDISGRDQGIHCWGVAQ